MIHRIEVRADCRFNPTGLYVEPGMTLIVRAQGGWTDWKIQTNADGYEAPHLWPFTVFRRVRSAPWFRLCGSIGRDGSNLFPLGSSTAHSVTASGPLYLFANDAWPLYFNNEGILDVDIEVRAEPPAEDHRHDALPLPKPTRPPIGLVQRTSPHTGWPDRTGRG